MDDEVALREKVIELHRSLEVFIPEEAEPTENMAIAMFEGWVNLYRMAGGDTKELVKLLMNLQALVFVSYWLGRRDERLEGMLGEVDMGGEGG